MTLMRSYNAPENVLAKANLIRRQDKSHFLSK